MNDAATLTEPDADEALKAQFRETVERMGLSQSEAARRADVSAPSLSQWLSGTYKGTNANIAAKVQRWIHTANDQAANRARTRRKIDFQMTPTAQRIFSLLALAQGRPGLVAICGAPGTGKSMAAEAYARANQPVWTIKLNPMVDRPHAMLCAIGKVLKVGDTQSRTVYYSVGERLRATGGLIVIDEAQHLKRPALDTLRSLAEDFSVGVALIGNAGLYAGLECSKPEDDFSQFHSRVTSRKQFKAPTPEDVEVILDAYGIQDGAMRKFLHERAGKIWGLRGVALVIEEASMGADERGQPLGLDHLTLAWKSLN